MCRDQKLARDDHKEEQQKLENLLLRPTRTPLSGRSSQIGFYEVVGKNPAFFHLSIVQRTT